MTRGNRTIREKKSDDEKSIRLQFRLHPNDPLEKWSLGVIKRYESDGVSLRTLIPEALAALENKPLPERQIVVNGLDVIDIKNALDYLLNQLESGAFASGSSGKLKRRKEKEIELPDSIRETLSRYASGGLTAEDDE